RNRGHLRMVICWLTEMAFVLSLRVKLKLQRGLAQTNMVTEVTYGALVWFCLNVQRENFPYSSPQPEGWINVYELMETIVNEPAPRAPSDLYSPEFCSFISACVQKDPKDRLSTNELMAHPFITKYDNLEIDLAVYFTSAGPPLATL
ncbi:UNVERIFIED_CONTAM: Mitogen-activated protein kinase kinase, partial [Sesamum latifolium]